LAHTKFGRRPPCGTERIGDWAGHGWRRRSQLLRRVRR